MSKALYFSIIFIGFSLLCFPLFTHLGDDSIRMWDESLNILHAINMYFNHNFLIRMRDGLPEMWETKPPLFIWLEVLSIKIFGFNEIAYRLPSVFAAIGIFISVFYFFRKLNIQQSIYSAFTVCFTMIGSGGFYEEHVVRNADHDSVFVFFTLIGILTFFLSTKDEKLNPKWFLISCISFSLGVLTKSIAPLMVFPGMLVFVLITKKAKTLLTSSSFYLGAIIFLLPVLSYYLIREHFNHGYLNAVYFNELLPRYTNHSDVGYNDEGFWYYYYLLQKRQFSYFFPLIIPSMFWGWFFYKESERGLMRYLIIVAIAFFIVISSGTNNFWYDFPLIVFLAIIIGLALKDIFIRLSNYFITVKPSLVLYSVFPLFLLLPYINTVADVTNNNSYNPPEVQYGYLFRKMQNQGYPFKTFIVLEKPISGWHARDYIEVANRVHKLNIEKQFGVNGLNNGAIVMTPYTDQKDSLNLLYETELLISEKDCGLYKIKNKKTK